jgi:hypothetical protein
MERDAVIGHGINEFLRESMMERGDEYQMVVCNTTGTLAVYNKARDLFMSPMADGPLHFFKSESGKGYALDTVTKYGRRFSVVSVPYSLKLLIQELSAINVQLRIITEDNLQQIESMSYSDNLKLLTLDEQMTPEKFVKNMRAALSTEQNAVQTPAEPFVNEPKEPQPTSPAYVPSPEEAAANGEEPKKEEPKKEEKTILQSIGSALGFSGGAPKPMMGGRIQTRGFEPLATVDSFDPIEPLQTLGAYTIDDFNLGDMVLFRRSVELGLPYDHPWIITKKGGRLITIKSARHGNNLNLTQHDYVQIARPDELIKPDEFAQWEDARQTAQMNQELMMPYPQPMMPQQQQQQPNINIRVVAGDDHSRNEASAQDGNGHTVLAGGGPAQNQGQSQSQDFNQLVIPKTGGKTTEKKQPEEKSIMQGLSDFGKLVINKIA